jgi:V/A-type H+-transporting ATPase subunit D
MELMRLKGRLKMAQRGHKLLKDKRDELMKDFLGMVRETRRLREEVEKKLLDAYQGMAISRAVMSPEYFEEALMAPQASLEVEVSFTNRMNIMLPHLKTGEFSPNVNNYGFAFTSPELDNALANFGEALPLLLRLAEKERSVSLLADEIERTRRRVNALEYVMIPELEETISGITMRLEEMERSNVSRLMKIKDIVRAE